MSDPIKQKLDLLDSKLDKLIAGMDDLYTEFKKHVNNHDCQMQNGDLTIQNSKVPRESKLKNPPTAANRLAKFRLRNLSTPSRNNLVASNKPRVNNKVGEKSTFNDRLKRVNSSIKSMPNDQKSEDRHRRCKSDLEKTSNQSNSCRPKVQVKTNNGPEKNSNSIQTSLTKNQKIKTKINDNKNIDEKNEKKLSNTNISNSTTYSKREDKKNGINYVEVDSKTVETDLSTDAADQEEIISDWLTGISIEDELPSVHRRTITDIKSPKLKVPEKQEFSKDSKSNHFINKNSGRNDWDLDNNKCTNAHQKSEFNRRENSNFKFENKPKQNGLISTDNLNETSNLEAKTMLLNRKNFLKPEIQRLEQSLCDPIIPNLNNDKRNNVDFRDKIPQLTEVNESVPIEEDDVFDTESGITEPTSNSNKTQNRLRILSLPYNSYNDLQVCNDRHQMHTRQNRRSLPNLKRGEYLPYESQSKEKLINYLVLNDSSVAYRSHFLFELLRHLVLLKQALGSPEVVVSLYPFASTDIRKVILEYVENNKSKISQSNYDYWKTLEPTGVLDRVMYDAVVYVHQQLFENIQEICSQNKSSLIDSIKETPNFQNGVKKASTPFDHVPKNLQN